MTKVKKYQLRLLRSPLLRAAIGFGAACGGAFINPGIGDDTALLIGTAAAVMALLTSLVASDDDVKNGNDWRLGIELLKDALAAGTLFFVLVAAEAKTQDATHRTEIFIAALGAAAVLAGLALLATRRPRELRDALVRAEKDALKQAYPSVVAPPCPDDFERRYGRPAGMPCGFLAVTAKGSTYYYALVGDSSYTVHCYELDQNGLVTVRTL